MTLARASRQGTLHNRPADVAVVHPNNARNSRQSSLRYKNTTATPAPPAAEAEASAAGESSAANPDPTMANYSLALVLLGFVGCVFFYSMNAVGKGEEIEGGELDPLAQLKAEAQEARTMEKYQTSGGKDRMSQEEIQKLETGRSASDDAAVLEAALEDEANRKVFGDGSDGGDEKQKKKKPWWRFGF